MSVHDDSLHDLPLPASSVLERIVDEFELAWQSGPRPPIEPFLPESPAERRAVLFELTHIDLELRIKGGEQRRVEDYLREFPELQRDRELLVSLIRAEFRFRRRLERDLGIEEYLHRFPQLTCEIGQLADFQSVEGDAPAVSSKDEHVTAEPLLANSDAPTVNFVSSPTPPRSAWGSEFLAPGYEFLGELGRGGMGVVCKARQVRLNRTVALKMILAGELAGEDERQRFQAEAEAVAKLLHPNIVQIYEIGDFRNRLYFSMEYVSGPSLAQHLAGAPQRAADAAQVVKLLSRAIAAAHAQGIIHRDLKPANVLLTEDGTPKVSDFGLAKQLASDVSRTQSGMVMGSPSYMSPEQALGDVRNIGPATDVYSLGAILYEMLTGRPPFRGENIGDTLHQVRYEQPVPPRQLRSRLSRDIETICLKCLQKDPARRYASAVALAEDLQRFLDGEPIVARPIGPVERAWLWARHHPAIAALSTAVVLITVVGFIAVTSQLIGRIKAQKRWVDAQIEAIRSASVESIPFFVASLSEFPEFAAERLRAQYDDPNLSASERIRVGLALLSSDPGLSDDLAELLLDAEPGEVRVICDEMARCGVKPPLFARILEDAEAPPQASEAQRDRFAQRKANAAIALARLGDDHAVWPLFRASHDNSVRSHLIHRWGICGGSVDALVDRWVDGQLPPDERRALLPAIGSFPAGALTVAEREALVDRLELFEQFEREPDAGLHAALRWLLGRWGKAKHVREVEERLAGSPAAARSWYVNGQLHTMTLLGPATFQMGSPETEEQRDPDPASELRHECRIDRRFSIAQQETTVAQFERFQKLRPLGGPDCLEPDCPARMVSWFEAAAYCNWLSEQEGIDQDQWCYLPDPDRRGLYTTAPDYLRRSGYRLPTEAEWEYACRAGTDTPRFFGYSLDLLPQYAWCLRKDLSGRKGAVATMMPNDFGLFDVYGNAHEWCNDSYAPYRSDPNRAGPSDDVGGPTSHPIRVLRGLAAGDVPNPRSALRDRGLMAAASAAIGFRVARTETAENP